MKTEGQIVQKQKQVIFRYLKKFISAGLQQIPENCRYNRQPKRMNGSIVDDLPQICIHAEQAGHVCSLQDPRSLDYSRCPFFTPLKSKEQLKSEFIALATSSREEVAQTMPDAAALMWVLEQEEGELVQGAPSEELALEPEPVSDFEPEALAPVVIPTPKKAPWWRFWGWTFWPWTRGSGA